MHHAKNVAKSIISDSKRVLCIKCMLYDKIVSGTYFWYIIKVFLEAKVTVSDCHNFLAV